MQISQTLSLRQTQNLVMTPQLQQAIKLLQMSNLELQSFIDQELEKNPLLEIDYNNEREGRDKKDNLLEASDHKLKENSQTLASDTFDTGLENVYADEARADTHATSVSTGGNSQFDSSDTNYENMLSTTITLREHLISQIGMIPCSSVVEAVTLYLVDHLDDAGYLRIDEDNLPAKLGITDSVLEDAIHILHELEPAGVGARDLAECLRIQLSEKQKLTPQMEILLQNLNLLAKHDLVKLENQCRVSREELLDMILLIRQLNPKPGASFLHTQPETLVPDVYVRRNHMNGWSIELNTESMPKLLINKTYVAQVKNTKQREAKLFIQECHQSASWLIKSLDQRAKTILKVATEIVRQQDEFFEYGITRLKPMNLKAIAEKIEMHESTVSRVTSNKYISTDRGVFELKFFFTAAISSMNGECQYSSESVRHQIKSFIDEETSDSVLSDDKIMELLRLQGIDIARRTIAKYREAMHIPSSAQRRRAKRSMLSV
jgi:RNA polymerase sigma-54 factor